MKAGRRYAGFQCDHCHRTVGKIGYVRVYDGIVWEAECPYHARLRREAQRKRLDKKSGEDIASPASTHDPHRTRSSRREKPSGSSGIVR